jgi:hypothetical protein
MFERLTDPARIHSPIREACGADRLWFGYGEKKVKKYATEITENREKREILIKLCALCG